MAERKVMMYKEYAMSLWVKQFGKEYKVVDYSGRMIAKGAYGDDTSDFGWTLDKILPKSQGGAETEDNLVCCHIDTAKEKGENYPLFIANGNDYEVAKVKDHYEIIEKEKKNLEVENGEINFLDPSQALKFYARCKKNDYHIQTIHVILDSLEDSHVLDFIREMFKKFEISIKETINKANKKIFDLAIRNYDVTSKDDITSMMDDCMILNTYLKQYFKPKGYFKSYKVFVNLYNMEYRIDPNDFQDTFKVVGFVKENCLFINSLLKETLGLEGLTEVSNGEYSLYDYYFQKLAEGLSTAEKI